MIPFAILVFSPLIFVVGGYIYAFFYDWWDIHRFRVRDGESAEDKREIKQEEADHFKSWRHGFIGILQQFGLWMTLPGCVLCWLVLSRMDHQFDLIGEYQEIFIPAWHFVHDVPYSFWVMIAVLVGTHFLLKRVDTHLADDDEHAFGLFCKDRDRYVEEYGTAKEKEALKEREESKPKEPFYYSKHYCPDGNYELNEFGQYVKSSDDDDYYHKLRRYPTYYDDYDDYDDDDY